MPGGHSSDPDRLSRLTFEDVLSAQIRLRGWIRKLMKANRKLTSSEDDKFCTLYERATLGIGGLVPFDDSNGKLSRMPGSRYWSINHVVFNMLVGEGDVPCGISGTQHTDLIPPQFVWDFLKSRLEGVIFPAALQQAVKLSKEKEWGQVSAGVEGLQASQ